MSDNTIKENRQFLIMLLSYFVLCSCVKRGRKSIL